jgi:hypothetical protein
MIDAAKRAVQLLDKGSVGGAEVWQHILSAVERLQANTTACDNRQLKFFGMSGNSYGHSAFSRKMAKIWRT